MHNYGEIEVFPIRGFSLVREQSAWTLAEPISDLNRNK